MAEKPKAKPKFLKCPKIATLWKFTYENESEIG